MLRSTIGGKAVFFCSGFNSFLDLAVGFPMVALSAKHAANVCHFEHLECFGKAFLSCYAGLGLLRLWTYGTIYIGGVVSTLLAGLWLGYLHIREGTYIACDHIAYVFILQEFRRKSITVLLFLAFQIARNHWLDMKLIVLEL